MGPDSGAYFYRPPNDEVLVDSEFERDFSKILK